MSTPNRDPRERSDGPPIWSAALAMLGGILVLGFLIYALYIGDLKALEPPWIAGGVLGASMVGGWLYVARDSLRRLSASQGARYSSVAIGMTVMALGIAVALNVVANRYDERIDLTEGGLFTLSDQTISIVEGLEQDVSILAFFGSGSGEEVQFQTLIEGYEQHTSHLKVEYYDPIRSPLLAEEHSITTQWGTVVLKAGDSSQRLESSFDEEALTNALVRLTAGKQHTICFAEGHGELDPADSYDGAGLGVAVSKLEGQNYAHRTVTLFRENGVPEDCEVLVAADPQYDWMPAEQELLAAYVAGGGHFLLMLEPGHADGLAADMARYGITVGNDLVLEMGESAQFFGGDVSYVLLTPDSFDFHPITEDIQGFTMHRIARSASKGAELEGINVQELAKTTDQSWAKLNLESITDITPDPAVDRMGPISLMVVAEITDPAVITVRGPTPEAPPIPIGEGIEQPAPTPEAPIIAVDRAAGGRVMVIGDVDFATNALLDQGNNMDLVLNTLAWMVGEEDQISIRRNEASESSITMSLGQGILVWLLCLLLAPGLALTGALVTWRTRRKL
ncbi:MAG: ABC-type uncharacterized transport system involved in gliding motility auxiliary subunit [Myxococcota bacterium]|jgi:ABC-type uncharacterized transport system involved in gliding motility auxiliary subunit